MKLSKDDSRILLHAGYLEEDMKQIERATTKTIYTLNDGREVKISQHEAMDLLGKRDYLITLGRSAFHWSANIKVEGSDTKSVYFDSSKLFV